jgi:hypothetical protein
VTCRVPIGALIGGVAQPKNTLSLVSLSHAKPSSLNRDRAGPPNGRMSAVTSRPVLAGSVPGVTATIQNETDRPATALLPGTGATNAGGAAHAAPAAVTHTPNTLATCRILQRIMDTNLNEGVPSIAQPRKRR